MRGPANRATVDSLLSSTVSFCAAVEKLDGDRAEPGVTWISSKELLTHSDTARSAFPSIRQLPLVGVRWAELYRQSKTEEAVYELLTQQYELAKIEEAKEIPTVKILDAADIPERKVTPRRIPIVLFGVLFPLLGAATWVILRTTWNQIDRKDARKVLAQSVVRLLLLSTPIRWMRSTATMEHAQ
jgi:G-rich domain on putative tyrosine kinase